jgi:Protein of unknown function (DUF3251)
MSSATPSAAYPNGNLERLKKKTRRLKWGVIVLFVLLILCMGMIGLLTANAWRESNQSASRFLLDLKIQEVNNQIQGLSTRIGNLAKQRSAYDSIALDPTEKGYGRIDTGSGFFLISVKDTTPYLDGYRVTLHIGNPTSARYDGFKLKIAWVSDYPSQKPGESDEDYNKRTEAWSNSGGEKEFSFTDTLYPGAWNTVSLVISPASAQEIRNLTIESMETSNLSLQVRN